MPTIYHPTLGESACSESAVRLHERNGWSTDKPSKKSAATPAAANKAASPAPTTNNGPTAGEES